jgi:hypothetical protein
VTKKATLGVAERLPYQYFSTWLRNDSIVESPKDNELVEGCSIRFFSNWLDDPTRTNMTWSCCESSDISFCIESINIKLVMSDKEIYRKIFDESVFTLYIGDMPIKSIPSIDLANPSTWETLPENEDGVNSKIVLGKPIAVPTRQHFYVTMDMTGNLQKILNYDITGSHKQITVTLNTTRTRILSDEEETELYKKITEKSRNMASENEKELCKKLTKKKAKKVLPR